ncbi:MAG: hypothetical protein FWG77_04925 [Treponema sp.]|nr:hypothetical protein [Treponema sp.]
MKEVVRDSTGKIREVQSYDPLPKPSGADHDCAYCSNKRHCATAAGRQFFAGVVYPPCHSYIDYQAQCDEEYKNNQRFKELSVVRAPTVRPAEGAPDCLHCKRLATPHNFRVGPKQGEGRVCGEYFEVQKRPGNAPKHCLYCLENYLCTRGRVVRNGQPCERYIEI